MNVLIDETQTLRWKSILCSKLKLYHYLLNNVKPCDLLKCLLAFVKRLTHVNGKTVHSNTFSIQWTETGERPMIRHNDISKHKGDEGRGDGQPIHVPTNDRQPNESDVCLTQPTHNILLRRHRIVLLWIPRSGAMRQTRNLRVVVRATEESHRLTLRSERLELVNRFKRRGNDTVEC